MMPRIDGLDCAVGEKRYRHQSYSYYSADGPTAIDSKIEGLETGAMIISKNRFTSVFGCPL
jgi:hypothetical protein